MLRLAFRGRALARAAVVSLALGTIAGSALAADPLFGGSATNAGSPAPGALEILAEAQRGPTLTERFGLPRVSGPLQIGLPPLVGEPLLGQPLPPQRLRQRAESPR
jgi:hypothetical protein